MKQIDFGKSRTPFFSWPVKVILHALSLAGFIASLWFAFFDHYWLPMLAWFVATLVVEWALWIDLRRGRSTSREPRP